MEEQLLIAGLTKQQALAYIKLIDAQSVVPSEFSQDIGEARSNTYKILDELVSKGLAKKFKDKTKIRYSAESPAHLLKLAREKKDEIELAEENLKTAVPELLKNYYKTHEQPSVRFFQGKDGINEIYQEQIRDGKEIQFLKTRADIDFFGFRFMHNIRILAPNANIKRKAFTPNSKEIPIDIKDADIRNKLTRTWYEEEDYTAHVEWSVYGTKVSIISFGKEAIGMVIDSEQISESLRQMFAMLDRGLRLQPGYEKMPNKAELVDVESFIKKHHNKNPT